MASASALEELYAVTFHELRAPISSINGYAVVTSPHPSRRAVELRGEKDVTKRLLGNVWRRATAEPLRKPRNAA
jgi:hypothetical protein